MNKSDVILANSELGKLIDSLNNSQMMRLQLATFFGTSSVLLLGYGFAEVKASIVGLASLFPVFFMVADSFILRGLYGYYTRSIRIIRVENSIEDETIFDMFRLFIVDRAKKRNALEKIARMTDKEKRFTAIRRLPYTMPTILGFYVPIIIFTLELGGALVLYFHFGWSF